MKSDRFGIARSFIDPSVVAALSAIPFLSRRPMLGNVSGRHPSPHRGSSVEFAEYRRYVPGDDPRRLDWRVVGRSDRFYVKEFEADTNLRCVFVVDTSGSLGFSRNPTLYSREASDSGRKPLSKLDYARRIAGTLAYLAVEQGDAVGLALVANKLMKEIPARRNPAHLSHIFDAIEDARAEGETQLPEMLHQLAETVASRALIIVISDLFVDVASLRSSFEHLRFRHHDVAVFHLLAPEELDFPFQKPTRFFDLESGVSLLIDPDEIFERYQDAVGEYLSAIDLIMRETNSDYHRVSIAEPYQEILSTFLIERASRRSRR